VPGVAIAALRREEIITVLKKKMENSFFNVPIFDRLIKKGARGGKRSKNRSFVGHPEGERGNRVSQKGPRECSITEGWHYANETREEKKGVKK